MTEPNRFWVWRMWVIHACPRVREACETKVEVGVSRYAKSWRRIGMGRQARLFSGCGVPGDTGE